MRRARWAVSLVALFALLTVVAPAAAQVQPYRANDYGGFRDVLPPGANGFASAAHLAAFLGGGVRQPHSDDQLRMYSELVYAVPGLRNEDLGRFFKDASFGVRDGDLERQYSPRADVVIQRDKGYGVPHVYGSTREGAIFGLGYVAAEDRLFFIDVLRNAGRAQLSSFAGGALGNREMDRGQWQIAPYTEADLQRQIDNLDDLYGERGVQLQRLLDHYVAGINAYITEAKASPLTKLPGEYAAINQPQGPNAWKVTDVIATASLVGGIFGKGGGEEIGQARLIQAWQQRFGRRLGKALYEGFRSSQDPEAPTTVHRTRFRYQPTVRKPAPGSVALPDPGTLKDEPVLAQGASASSRNRDPGVLGGREAFSQSMSNALLVSGRESESGRPLAVFGPQTAYFQPQVLMEQDVHAPGWDARGAAFPGVNVIVQLGRGQDYAWSATSAGQDIIDTFALDLCEPSGREPTLESTHYVFRGQCLPMERLLRSNSWAPSVADQTPPGSETLVAWRTKMGIVAARGRIDGKPVAYAKLRATYMHEADSALGFQGFNDPAAIRSPQDFQRAASEIAYTFNWFYVDDRDIAYFNSGNNPRRAPRTDGQLPIRGLPQFEWRNFDPERVTAAYTPFEQHPQAINQTYMTSWNNRQAPGYAGSPTNHFGSLYRSQPLDDRIKGMIKGPKKMTLAGLVEAMEDAGTVDLRGDKVLPWALKILGRPSDPALADAVAKLRAWKADGAHRRDRDRNGVYEHTDAIRIMDAWWPLWMEAQFKPRMGDPLFKALQATVAFDNDPNNHHDHLGSAYQDGWYSFAHKDLRTIYSRKSRRRVKGRYARTFCGAGRTWRVRRERCRQALSQSLAAALRVDPAKLYQDTVCASAEGNGLNPQWCFDSVRHRPVGGITQPLIHWINRPTYQQAVEVQGHRPR